MKQLISYYRMPGDREKEILASYPCGRSGWGGKPHIWQPGGESAFFANHCGNASQVLALLDGFL